MRGLERHVHTVKSRTRSGGVKIYRYHRLSRRRLYCEPGTPAFEAELARASTGLPVYGTGERPKATRVYFIRAQATGLIKIGKAARPRQRLQELQIGSPDNLELLGTIEDKSGGALEAALHARFGRHLVRGEWFKPAPDILDYIADHAR